MTSISIACFNNIFFTRQCIESIYKNTEDFELIIVDNASTDGTFEYIKSLMDSGKKITLIQNDKNAGFAYAHNQALEQAKGKYFLPLNNDTICLKNWLTEMLKPFSDPKIGIVGSKLLMPGSRNIQHAGVYFLDNGIPYHTNLGSPDDENTSTSKIVPAVTGACMAIKTDLFREVGGFDTAYVNGWEDIDLCLKLRKLGYNIFYQATSVLYHYEGQTEGRLNNDNENRQLFMSRWAQDIQEWGNKDYSQYLKIKEKNDLSSNTNIQS